MKKTSTPEMTRQRLLEGAARVYARDGIAGATTRAIAVEAGVNEVTLFRHFKSKDRLLSAVIGETFTETNSPSVQTPKLPGELRADLLVLARHYEQLLTDNLPLVRTMIGEVQHHGRENERRVFRSIFRPIKEAVVARIAQACEAGELRNSGNPDLPGDYLGSMIFTGVLRRASAQLKLTYTPDSYLEGAVDLLLRGMAPEVPRA